MGHWKYPLMTLAASLTIGTFVACNQNNTNQKLKSGTTQSDGVNVISQGPIGGVNLNIGISNINLGSGTTAQGTTYPYSQVAGTTAGTVATRFDLLITNTQNTGYSYYYASGPTTVNAYATIYNPAYLQWYGNTTTGLQCSYFNSTGAQIPYCYETKCSSQACELMYVNFFVYVGNDLKQIGIKKSMTLNRILGVTEYMANSQNYKSTDQIITELSNGSTL